MTEAARQRAAVPKTCSSNAWLPVAVLAAFAACAQAHPQATATAGATQDAQAAPPPPNRGVSAQAASDAVARQHTTPSEMPAQPIKGADVEADPGQAQAAEPVVSVPVEATASVVAVRPAALRGVMFRITPPAAVTLPAEALVQAPPVTVQAYSIDAAVAAPPVETPAVLPVAVAPTPSPPRPSYLLATIHFGTPEEQGLDYAVLERALSEVDTFVNEADLDSPWQPAFDGYRWLPEQEPLSKMIGPDSFAMARSLLPKVRTQDLERMKPWSVLALLEARGESGGEATMDARLQRVAAAAGKRLVHLESLEQQLQALDCVPASEHALVLDERLKASWILRIGSARAMAWYRSRNLDAWLADIDRMEGLGESAKAIEQRARQCLLEERNARWIGQLQTLFQDGPCLVAVGAVHLVGVDGLLAALRRDGYQVEAVPL